MNTEQVKIYQQQCIITKEFLQDIPICHERNFILEFLKSIPLENLKLLVNFKEIDPVDESFWIDAELNNDEYMLKKLNMLASRKAIEFNVKIKI